MECPECRQKIPENAKFCQECGAKLNASGSVAKISDSVVTHSPGAGSVISVNTAPSKEQTVRCDNCENEISKENRRLKCLECGKKFCEYCETFYRKDRLRGEKPLCEECYSAFIKKVGQENPGLTTKIEVPIDYPPFNIGSDFDYVGFFDDIRKMITPELPDSGDPDGHIWYRIPAGLVGAHFEFYFELYKWRRLGVELHFETNNPRWNQAMLSEMVKYMRIIEKQTGERVYIQRNWGRPIVWSRIYLANTHLENVEELKIWAAEKMKIFYRILQPRLKELR